MVSLDEILFGIVSIPVVIVLSLFLEGIDRKANARMQRRIGPPVIQPFYDVLKLLRKSYIVPVTAAPYIFILAPILAALCAISSTLIVIANIVLKTHMYADLMIVIYLMAMPSLMKVFGGSSSGNPYAAIGASRMMTMIVAYKLPLLVSMIPAAIKGGSTLSISDIVQAQTQKGVCYALSYPSTALAAVSFLLCIPAEAGVVPFDIPEAKTEIIHGTLIEYGGPYLALFRIAKSTIVLTLVLLASALFFYSDLSLIWGQAEYGFYINSALVFIVAVAIMLLTITVPRTIFARLKTGQALRFFWIIPLGLGLFGSLLSSTGM